MSNNSTILLDPHQLAHDDLIDEYARLAAAYRQLKRTEEHSKQHIYELTRAVQTATNAEAHLAAELEEVTSNHATEVQRLQQHSRNELDDIKLKLLEAREAVAVADVEQDRMRKTNAELRKSVEELKQALQQMPQMDVTKNAQVAQCLARAEQENDALLEALRVERDSHSAALKQIVQLEVSIRTDYDAADI